MRIIVFFDLPTYTAQNRRDANCFRKTLIKNGFYMMQESVYCKLITSPTVKESVKNMLIKNKPPKGLVQALLVTEKQFSKMDYIVGSAYSNVVDSEDRVVIL